MVTSLSFIRHTLPWSVISKVPDIVPRLKHAYGGMFRDLAFILIRPFLHFILFPTFLLLIPSSPLDPPPLSWFHPTCQDLHHTLENSGMGPARRVGKDTRQSP